MLPVEVIRTLYFSHIHSHLNYNLSVWGSMLSKSQVSDISQLQQKCIRHMIKKSSIPVDAIFRKLKLLKFSDMIKIELCKFGAHISNNVLPKPLQELMKKRSGWKTHGYDTRDKCIPNTQKHTTTHFNISFMHHGISEYSNLTFDFKSIMNISTLTTMITSYYEFYLKLSCTEIIDGISLNYGCKIASNCVPILPILLAPHHCVLRWHL